MREYGFSTTRILPYNDIIYNSALTQKNTAQWKPTFSHVLCSERIFRKTLYENMCVNLN